MFTINRLSSVSMSALVVLFGMTIAACGGGADDASSGDGDVPAAGSIVGTVTGDVIVIDRDLMSDLPCHAMDNSIMGLCNEADIAGLLAEVGLNTSEIIIHDKQLMADEDCHVMERTIMGICSDEDVEYFAEEIRTTP